MNWRQTLVTALLVGVIAAGIVWFLEDFERQKIVAGVSAEWTKYVQGLPAQGGSNVAD